MTLSGGQSLAIGVACDNAGVTSQCIGYFATIAGGQANLAIGQNCSAGSSDGSSLCVAIGQMCNNTTPNSFLLGDPDLANIRPNSSVCTLGTVDVPFQDIFLSGSVIGPNNSRLADDVLSCSTPGVSGNIATFTGTAKVVQDSGVLLSSLAPSSALANYLPLTGGAMTGPIDSASALSLGTSSATSVSIGNGTIETTVNGTFVATVSSGSWYSSTNFSPTFAGVALLIPPTTATAGSLSLFTHSLGVLTCTSTRTRTYRISYNISFEAGASGANMAFYNSINGSTLALASGQAIVRYQVNANNAGAYTTLTLTDLISLGTNDTVQLCATCQASSSAVVFNYVSCNITSLTN